MLFDQAKRQNLINKLSSHINSAELECSKLATYIKKLRSQVQNLISISLEVVETCARKDCALRERALVAINECMKLTDQQLLISIDLGEPDLDQAEKNYFKEDVSQISFVSGSSCTGTLMNEWGSSEAMQQNCQELKLVREIVLMKKDVKGLRQALEDILQLKRTIRQQLQEEMRKVESMYEQLVQNQRKLHRMEDFAKEQKTQRQKIEDQLLQIS